MTAQRTFTSRVNKKANQERLEDTKIFMELVTEDDETGAETFREGYTFTRPAEGRLFLMATAFGAASQKQDAASEVDATLRAMLLDDKGQPGGPDYLKLRERIDGPIEKAVPIEDIMEVIGMLTEEWSEGFPTQQSSDSSAAPARTGGRSTGRAPGRTSTRSTSSSPAS